MADKDLNDLPIIKQIGDFIDWISGAEAHQEAGRTQRDGLKEARDIIQKAYATAKEELAPYQKAGQEDFNNLRGKVNSGYYRTPYPGSYQPPSFPTQGFDPGAFNQATQSYGGTYQPWEMPTPGLLKMPGLPSYAPPQQPTPQQPGQGGLLGQMVRPNAMGLPVEAMMDSAMNMTGGSQGRDLGAPMQNLSGQPPNPYEQAKKGLTPNLRDPMTMQEWLAANRSTQPGSLPYRGSGPFMPDPMQGRGLVSPMTFPRGR